jgi:hypothetical protein
MTQWAALTCEVLTSGGDEDSGPLERDAVSTGIYLPRFRKMLMLLSLCSRNPNRSMDLSDIYVVLFQSGHAAGGAVR